MKTNHFLFTALTVLALCSQLLAGCSSEIDMALPDDVNPAIPEGMTQLNFDIKGVRTGTSYVALTADESQLKDLYVFLFPQGENGPTKDAVCKVVLKAKITTKDGLYKAAVLVDQTIPVGKYYAILLANMNALMGEHNLIDANFLNNCKGQNYTDLFVNEQSGYCIAASERTGQMPVAICGLGMKALVEDITVTEADRGDAIPLRATLTRPQARFDIKNTAYKSFTITGYQRKNIQPGAKLCFFAGDIPWPGIIRDFNRTILTDAQKTLLNTPSYDDDGDPATPAVMGYNQAFYLYPGQASDKTYIEITGELKVSAGGTRTVTYTIPLKTNTPDEYIAIQSNKRYKMELKMLENEQLVGDVMMDAGTWDDEGGIIGDDEIEETLPGEITAVTGATYDAATKTFNVAEKVTTFGFTFQVSKNKLRPSYSISSGIVMQVEKVATLVAPTAKYTVTLADVGTTGGIEEIITDKNGLDVVVNSYKVQRAGAPVPPADVNGHKPVLIDNFWFVDPSPVGVNNKSFAGMGIDVCPSGWRLPTSAELIDLVGATGMKAPYVDPRGTEYAITKNKDFEERLGTTDMYGILCNDSYNDGADNAPEIFNVKNEMASYGRELTDVTVRCVQTVK